MLRRLELMEFRAFQSSTTGIYKLYVLVFLVPPALVLWALTLLLFLFCMALILPIALIFWACGDRPNAASLMQDADQIVSPPLVLLFMWYWLTCKDLFPEYSSLVTATNGADLRLIWDLIRYR